MVELAYEWRPAREAGPVRVPAGERPFAGLPLVLLHAFPLDRRMWQGVASHLAALDLLLVDLPGLGASPLPAGEPALETAADAVHALMGRLGLPRAVLAGVSMGGYVTMAFARRHPDRLAGAALIDTRADPDGSEARENRERIARAVLGEAGTRVLAPMLDTLLGGTTHRDRPRVVARVREWLAAARPEGVAWSQRAMAARGDSTPVLAGLGVPVSIVVGEEDGITPPPLAVAMTRAVPDGVLTVLPRAGHLTPSERPEAVAHALAALHLRCATAVPTA